MAYYYLYSTIPKKPLTSIFMSSPHIIFNFSLHKFVPSTTPSLFPSLHLRHRSRYCTWVSAVSCSVAETDEQHHIARYWQSSDKAACQPSATCSHEVPNWKEVFGDATLPLMVDIGSGSGRFLMWLAKRNSSSKNFLGLEIRPKLVTRAEYWVNELGLKNVHFISTNAMVSFQRLVSTYPGPLMLVSILVNSLFMLECPDPHFKKKHHKRRVVQKPLVESVTNNLAHGGQVFIQSDVLDVAVDMRNYFDDLPDKLVHIDSVDPSLPCDSDGWVLNNPMGIRTEREIHAEFEGCKIYRRVYQKVQH
ncbi:uncharacterized protein [Nicotiana tomentosiformis]|uniref:uncharacterized protein isoform X3 n=1 Tax=Nicotiana tomentosiformis TaxID=4098 RepID=UPI00051C13DB|nr:tRNA (guanine-N(7)-)-methyltransferase isoform X3 [Nicotiana tomentosiformis]